MAKITRQPTRKTLQPHEKVIEWIKRLQSSEEGNLNEFSQRLFELIAAWPVVPDKTDLFHWSELLNLFDEKLESIFTRCIPTGKLQAAELSPVEKTTVLGILQFSRILLETCSSRNIYNSYDRLNGLLRCEDLEILEGTLELLLIPARKIESQKSLSDKFDNLIDYRVVEALAQCVLPPLNPPSENESIELQFAYRHLKLVEERKTSASTSVEYCRLLALSIYLMMSSDIPADVTGFSIHPTIIADTARLLSATPTSENMKIGCGALSAMRGFLKFDSKWTETIYSMDAAASHGPIATIFKTISHCILQNEEIPYNQAFLTAFYDLTTGMANCAEFDEALVTSTIIDDIVRCFPTCEAKYYKIIEKLVSVLDPLIQFMTEALDAFFGADGLSLIVKHISVLAEMIKSMPDDIPDSELKQHISYLSSLLKFVFKLLKQFGSNDRLRNLIEGSLFKTIKMIFEAQGLFGPDVFHSATHILATFIHTEPTSLSILQEGGVPQALLRAISENPIPANAELLITLPQAFDAICLNSSGISAFMDSDPLPNYLRFLSDPAYFRELQQNHVAVSKAMAIGDAVNEFMRHHPNLSSVIIPNLVEAVDLLQAAFRVSDEPVSIAKPEDTESVAIVSFDAIAESESKRRFDPIYVNMMESMCLFIESIVKTPAHRDAFMSQRGTAKLLECYVTPQLPADFTNSQACASINHCFHVLAESDPVPVMADISSYIKATKDRLESFIESKPDNISTKSQLLNALINQACAKKEWDRIRTIIHNINVFGSLVALLADLCFAQHMNFSRPHARIIPAILEQPDVEETMQYIGHLMRCCLYEYWSLRKELEKPWLASACRFSQLSPFKSAKEQEIIPVPAEIRVLTGVVDPKQLEYADPEDLRIKNLKACLTILRQVPTSVIAFFSGLARSLASRRTVSTVLAELTPEQTAKGLELLIKAVEFDDFISTRSVDVYLRNRLVSAGISITNLVFIDESNFKMTLHMQALGIFRSLGCFDRLSKSLETVFSSINTEDAFAMISVNDVFESIYGVLSRITDENLLRGNYWDEAEAEKYRELPYLFEFSAIWTSKMLCELSRMNLIPSLSIECIQLILASASNLMLIKNDLHITSNLCLMLEELRAGKSDFNVDKIEFSNLPRFGNFIGVGEVVRRQLLEALLPALLDKSKDLSFDLAQLLTRFSATEGFFKSLCEGLLDSSKWTNSGQIARNSQLIAVILNSPLRTQIVSASKSEFESFFVSRIDELIRSASDESERNLLVSAFGLCSAQLSIMFLSSLAQSNLIPSIDAEIIAKIYKCLLDYLQMEKLSVDAVHALLLCLVVLTKDSSLEGSVKICQILPIVLKLSTKCLESDDSRHKTIVSLVALILRHLVETPAYLTALLQQEMSIRFKAQHEAAFEIEDLISFAEPYILRSIPCALEAAKKCFGADVISESAQEKMKSLAGNDVDLEINAVPLYSLKGSLSALLSKRQEKLQITVNRAKEQFLTASPGINAELVEIPKVSNNAEVLTVLKDSSNSPLAENLVSALLDQIMQTNRTLWPQCSEDLKTLESDEELQFAHFYRCALLLFLSELILAYPVCHAALLANPKTGEVFEFLFKVMTPYGNVRYTHINQAYERSWVQYLLINTCMGSIAEEASLSVPGSKMNISNLPESMANSCKFVVNCLFSELKRQCNEPADDNELRIGRIFGLSDTIYCLLTIKSSTVGRWASSMTAHLASLLIENRVIHLLSTALQFIDSNNPAYEEVTVNVVRTLEALCKYSNKFAKLAAKKNGHSAGAGGALGSTTDFSQLLQDFSSDDSGYSDDYGYESGSDEDDSEDDVDIDESGLESDDDMDLSDSEIDSEDEFDDSEDDDDDSEDEDDSDLDSDEDIIEIIPEMDIDSVSGDLSLSSVRGRNTRIATSGPYELIVEEIGEENESGDSDDSEGRQRGFPVGSEDDDEEDDGTGRRMMMMSDEDAIEYDYNHHGGHHHGHHHHHDDFDSDEHDHIDEDEDMMDEEDDEDEMMMNGMRLDDDDWNDHMAFGGGASGGDPNVIDFMELPGRSGRSRGHHHPRNRNELNALLHGLNSSSGIPLTAASTYSGQARMGAGDPGVHPLLSRPTLDPLADPLRAHLPLTQPVSTQPISSRPMSIVIGRGDGGSSIANGASAGARVSRVNAEPFHFPQAVATNRRWAQENRFTVSDLSRLICSAVKEELETILRGPASEELRLALKALEAEEDRVMDLIQKATADSRMGTDSVSPAPSETSNASSAAPVNDLKTVLSEAIANIKSNEHRNINEDVEFIDEGMDVEFLQAVPREFYEELISQYLVERRNRIPPGVTRVTISPDFLARLPQNTRDLYVRMSEEEVRAFRLFGVGSSNNSSNVSGSGRSSGNRSLSGEAAAESVRSETFRELIADVSNFLMGATNNEAGLIAAAAEPIPTVPLKELPLSSIQSIPTMDPSSLVSILRSYYSPVISERRLHHKLFQSLVANPRTRLELINLLIYVLERMPADMNCLGTVLDGYVESLTGAASSIQPGKPIKRSRSGSNMSSSSSLNAPGSPSPLNGPPLRPQTPLVTDSQSKTHIPVLQRTLQLLLHLCSHNDDVCAFFTSPVEKPWTIKRHDRSNKRLAVPSGAINANAPTVLTITTKFPLVLVMACMERAAFSESSLLIEYLLHLLDIITAPLSKVVNPQDLKIDIPPFLLSSLVKSLVACEFTPKAFQYASHVFQNLSVLPSPATILLNDLTDSSNRCVDELIDALKELIAEGEEAQQAAFDMKTFSQSKAAPAKFLRLIKTTSSLCLQVSKEDRSQDRLIEKLPMDAAKLAEQLKSLGRFENGLERCLKSRQKSEKKSNEAQSGEQNYESSSSDQVNETQSSNSQSNSDPESLQFALVLLPVIEAFFLLHRLIQALEKGDNSDDSGGEPGATVLIRFSEEHRGLLNSLIRTKPSLLTQGSLATLTRIPRLLEFDNKRIFFKQQLHRKKPDQGPAGTLNITVQRAHVFEDSFRALQGKSGEEVKWGRLSIKFAEEEGVDAGGVAREWFSVLARQMFNPDYVLFRTSAADRITYQPNRMSYINPDHLLYFHFIGRIIGKAVFDSRLLDCHFTRSFYKHILRIPVETKDMEAVDPELYKSLCWMEENDITGVFDDMTFTTESDEFGTLKSVELKDGGAQILVTEANKREYIHLLTEFKLTTAIKPQIDAFLRGFNEIVPARLISVFNEQELELLISGMPEIDLDDWKAHCEYHGGYSIASPQIQWYWRAVRSFDSETRAKLIQFVTGTSKVPLEGFAKLQGSDGIQKFQIHRDPRTKDRLPTAHTCFNQLDLPEYETYEELRHQLLLAIHEGETGFGFI